MASWLDGAPVGRAGNVRPAGRRRQGCSRAAAGVGPHSAYCASSAARPSGSKRQPFPLVADVQSPLVVDALREQLLRVLDWYHHSPPEFRWGTVIHRRNDRGRLQFGAITPQGESFVLTQPLLDRLGEVPCWLDGAVRVRLECRKLTGCLGGRSPAPHILRPPLVEALAVYFDPDTSAEETIAFQAMAGILTPSRCPSELFVLTRRKPGGWPL